MHFFCKSILSYLCVFSYYDKLMYKTDSMTIIFLNNMGYLIVRPFL